MVNIAVLVTGGGTNLQALLDAQTAGTLASGRVTLAASNRSGAGALERARQAGVETLVLEEKAFTGRDAWDEALRCALLERDIGLVVLAGFLGIVGPRTLAAVKGRIVNIHPSLLPSFGGKGFYGLAVHRAALERGVKITGATVHFVDETIDGGVIIMQKAVNVEDGDTPQTLQRRVLEQAEWQILPAAVERLCAYACRSGTGPSLPSPPVPHPLLR